MTYDLAKRLREVAEATGPNEARQIALDAADRIEELEAKLLANRVAIMRLGTKLDKATEALNEAWYMLTVPVLDYESEPEEPGLRRIKTTLEELNGKKSRKPPENLPVAANDGEWQ